MMFRRSPRTRGQAMVEFALVFPLVLLLMLGVLDLGRAVFAYNAVANAARSGARVAIVNQDHTLVASEAQREAVLPITVGPLAYPYDDAADCLNPGCVIRVEVTHQWTAATPIIGNIVGPIAITSASELPVERVSP